MKLRAFFFTTAVATCALAEPALQTVVDDAWVGAQGYHFSGRLTEIRPAPGGNDGRWRSLYRNTRQLLTSGEEGSIAWRVGTLEWATRADDHGYWQVTANQPLALAPGWHKIETTPTAASAAYVFVHDSRNTLGIISDVDDTVVISDVSYKTKLLRNSLIVPPAQRKPVEGMASLYQRLLAQNPAPEIAPLFYVSGSPKQLTENLRLFLQENNFPRGVLQLKEVFGTEGDSLRDQQAYKLRRIQTILDAFPGVRFSLFGDDGEHDPEIYAEIVRRNPQRIVGVWIRRVNPDPARARFPGQEGAEELLNPKNAPGVTK